MTTTPSAVHPVPVKPWHGLAIAGFVTALVGIILGLIPIFFLAAWIGGAVGLVFSIVGRKHKLGKWGIALAIVALALGGVGYGIVDHAVNDLSKSLQAPNATAPAVPAPSDTATP